MLPGTRQAWEKDSGGPPTSGPVSGANDLTWRTSSGLIFSGRGDMDPHGNEQNVSRLVPSFMVLEDWRCSCCNSILLPLDDDSESYFLSDWNWLVQLFHPCISLFIYGVKFYQRLYTDEEHSLHHSHSDLSEQVTRPFAVCFLILGGKLPGRDGLGIDVFTTTCFCVTHCGTRVNSVCLFSPGLTRWRVIQTLNLHCL